MYKCLLRCLVLFVCTWTVAFSEEASSRLDLRQCYERALEHNETIGVAVAEWRAAEARYRQVRDSLLPSVSLQLGERLQNERETNQNGGNNAPDQFEARVHAEQILYSGFRLTRAADARKAEGQALRLDSERTRELLYLDIADVFYQIMLCEQDLAVLTDLVDALKDAVDELEKRVKLGRSRRADLLDAETDLAEARVEVEYVRGQRDAAQELLAFLVDMPAQKIMLRDESPFPDDPELDKKLANVSSRSDILAEEIRVTAAEHDLRAARGERQPEIAAQGDVYLYESPDQDHDWSMLFTLTLPLFDEGVIRSSIDEREENYRISELNLSYVRRRAESEVRNAYITFMASAGQRARLREAVRSARENYTIQKKDYELGRASQLDALSSLAQWQLLRRREVAAEMQARASLVRLHVAAGEGAP